MIIDKMLKEGHLQEQDVKGCQIFDFGSGTIINDFTEEESTAILAFNEGFLNLPAPRCIFTGHAILPASSPNREEKFHLVFRLTQPDEQGDIEVSPFIGARDEWLHEFLMKETPGTANITFNTDGAVQSPSNATERVLKSLYACFFVFVTVSLGRLISDGIEQEKRIPPEKLNKRRIARGHPEMVSHTVVKLKPYRPPMGHSGSQGEYFTPKRYHFRRGHVRRFRNGQKTWVRSCFVGDISQGRVEHRYEVSA